MFGAIRPDAAGVVHPLASAQARIACLVPSITELLVDLGLGPQLVARTGYCIHPREAVRRVPKVGGTKDVNLVKLRRLAPDYVVVNIDENRKETAEALAEFVPHVVVTHPQTFADNLELFRLFGELFAQSPGVGAAAQTLARSLEAQIQGLPLPVPDPLRVLYLIWKDPWMTVGRHTYVADVLQMLGAKAVNPDTSTPQRYPAFDLAQIDWDSCDAVLLSSEPFRFDQGHLKALDGQLFDMLGRHIPLRLVDGELFTWYGSRSLKTVQYGTRLLGELRSVCRR